MMPRQGSFSQAEYASKKKAGAAGQVFGRGGTGGAVGRAGGPFAPALPQGRARPPADWSGADAAVYFLRQWYGLVDEALEDALYDSEALRSFAGIDLPVESVPDATTLLKFRNWLEQRDLTRVLFDEIGAVLEERGLLMRQGLPRRRPGARSSMRPSSPPHPRPRTAARRATRRC